MDRGAPSRSSRARGEGASVCSASSSRPTPKFETAEPKKTGVALPESKSAASSVPPAPSSSSSSSAAVAQASPSRAAACAAVMSSSGARLAPPAVRVKRWKVPVLRSTTPRKSPGIPTGHVAATGLSPSTDSMWSIISSGSRPGRSYLLTNVISGMLRACATSNRRSVCGSTPFAASSSITAQSAAASTRSVSSEKSLWPGVSSRLKTVEACSKRSTVLVTEIPRRRSMSIQSEVVERRLRRPCTAPATSIASEYSRSFSVSVVLPASGCEMIANVRRRAASAATVLMGVVVTVIAATEGSGAVWGAPGPGRCRGWALLRIPESLGRGRASSSIGLSSTMDD